jgi:hypothetical protein
MARKNQKGYSLPNLASMGAQGRMLELSAIVLADELRLFFRGQGHIRWQPVMTQRKDGPVSYKITSLGALVDTVATELPNVPFRLRYAGRSFFSGCHADPTYELISSHYLAAAANLQAAVLALLNIPSTVADKPWHILVALTYERATGDALATTLAAQMLTLPANWLDEAASATRGNE